MILYERHLGKACELLSQGQTTRALGTFRSVHGPIPPVEKFLGAAICLLLLWRVEEALEEFSRALDHPGVPKEDFFPEESVDGATRQLERWLAMATCEDPVVCTSLALLYALNGQRRKALEFCGRALRREGYPPARRLDRRLRDRRRRMLSTTTLKTELAELLSRGRLDQAEQLLEEVGPGTTTDEELHHLRCELFLRQRRPRAWVGEMKKLMLCQVLEGREGDAIQTGQRLLERVPAEVSVLEQLVALTDRVENRAVMDSWFPRVLSRLIEDGRWREASEWLHWQIPRLSDRQARSSAELELAKVEFHRGRLQACAYRLSILATHWSAESLLGFRPSPSDIAVGLNLLQRMRLYPEKLDVEECEDLIVAFQGLL